MRFAPIAAAALLCAIAQAQAEPATPEGAKAMLAAYAAYLPPPLTQKQVVAITPEGDDYVVTWDVEKLLAALDAPADMVKTAPLTYRVTPAPGGGWKLIASALPLLTIAPTTQGGRDGGTVGFDGFRFEGVYDPAAPEFFRGKLGLQALATDLKTKAGGDLQHVVMKNDGIAADIRVKTGAAPDSADISVTGGTAGSTQKTSLIDADKETPLTETHQGAATGDAGFTGLRARALGDLWRFLVAHAGDEDPPEDELKAKLTAALPLWKELSGAGDLGEIAVTFPGGSVNVKSAREQVKLTGIAATSTAALTLAFDRVAVETGAAPAWLKEMWPASLALTLEAGVDGLDKAAPMALEGMDEDLKLDDDKRAEIAEGLTEGRPHVGLKATRLTTPMIEATFEGEASYGDEGPAAHAKITADSLDKVLSALGKAAETDTAAQQAIYFVTFARGLAKSEDGRLVWNIEYLGPNSVEINGQKFPPG